MTDHLKIVTGLVFNSVNYFSDLILNLLAVFRGHLADSGVV